jgi:hypothetical protein
MATQAEQAELGPIDVAVIGYPAGAPLTGSAASRLLDLVDQGIIRVLDARFVIKEADGTVSGFEAHDLDEESVGSFVAFEGASSGLLGDADVATAGQAIEPGTAAALIVYENRWAVPFITAVHENGGVLVDNQRITHQDLLDSLDSAEATQPNGG